MPHDRDERPTSLWKKEISFKRKPREDAPDVEQQPVASSSGSVWKKELSLRRKPKVADEPTASGDEPVGDAPAPEPPVAAAAEPAPPSVDHGWLTQPLEEISDPPAEETTDLLPPPRPTLHALPQPEVEASETNPRGFYEPQWVIDFHKRHLRELALFNIDSRPAASSAAVATTLMPVGVLLFGGPRGPARPKAAKAPKPSRKKKQEAAME